MLQENRLQEIRVRFDDDKKGDGRFRVQLTDAAGKACGVEGEHAVRHRGRKRGHPYFANR